MVKHNELRGYDFDAVYDCGSVHLVRCSLSMGFRFGLHKQSAEDICTTPQQTLLCYGTTDAPIPMRYYIPGDRVWFKNPDEHSSNAPGFEGSWAIYLGQGRFSNFWRRDAPYSMEDKAIEIYHWRHGVFIAPNAGWQMNELTVDAEVVRTRSDPIKRQKILKLMNRYRDPMGIYSDGGCIDASREFPRQLKSIVLP